MNLLLATVNVVTFLPLASPRIYRVARQASREEDAMYLSTLQHTRKHGIVAASTYFPVGEVEMNRGGGIGIIGVIVIVVVILFLVGVIKL